MARQPRIEYVGAVYHVMARGNQGQRIFADDLDCKRWLETLAEACEKTGWRVHAYVLMGNHYHLLLETPEANLVAGMKWLQSTYTQRYNSRHEVFGHLFQGRYKALVVEGARGNYLGVASTYIHLNPARARLIKIGKEALSRYRWSSYPEYLRGRRQRPGWLETSRVMGSVGLAKEDRDGYEAYLEGRTLELGIQAGRRELEEQWRGIRRGWCLGDKRFHGRMLKQVEKVLSAGRKKTYSGGAKRAHAEGEAQRLLSDGMRVLGVGAEELARGAKGMEEKQVLAWWVSQRTTVPRRWVSERLGMGDESRVTQSIRQVQGSRSGKLRTLRQQLERTSRKEPVTE